MAPVLQKMIKRSAGAEVHNFLQKVQQVVVVIVEDYVVEEMDDEIIAHVIFCFESDKMTSYDGPHRVYK